VSAASSSDGHDRPGTEDGTAAQPADRRGFLSRHGLKLLVSLILGGGLAWVLARGGLPILPAGTAFSRLRVWAIAPYLVLLSLVHVIRALRWRHLLWPIGRVPLRSIVAVSFVAFAAILMAPLRSGEIVRPLLVARRGTVRVWEATGTIGAERVLDGLALSGALFLALQFATTRTPMPDHVGELPISPGAVPGAAYATLVLFVTASLVMALFYWRRELARRITRAVLGLVSTRLADAVSTIVERVAAGLGFLPSARHITPFAVETVLYWGTRAASIWLLGWACGLDGFTLAQAMVVLGAMGIGILVPAGPGYFGAYQLSSFMALAMFFPEDVLLGPGAAFVFIDYLSNVAAHLLAALVGLGLDPGLRSSETATAA
jgi:hypothetical protein